MKTVRHTIVIKGVDTTLLFTPRLFEFKSASMNFMASDAVQVAGMYADLAYCAALNYWTLCDKDIADFKFTRLDFHEWSAANPAEYGKMMRIAIEAITNKSLEELAKESTAQEKTSENSDVKKKTCSSIIQRLKDSWSAIVGCRKKKQHGHP